MNVFKSSSQLKAVSRESLLGNYAKLISALLTAQVALFIIDYITSGVTSGRSFGVILYYLVLFLVQLISGIFTSGTSYLYLNFASGRPFRVFDVFHGFQSHPDKAIILQTVNVFISLLILLPAMLIRSLFLNGASQLYLLGALVLLFVGMIISIYLGLSLSQCFYMIHDFPDCSAPQILKMSWRMMKGYRWKLFYLNLSFLPLMLVSFLSFGLGLLWVIPYRNTVYTNFYFNLIDVKSAQH